MIAKLLFYYQFIMLYLNLKFMDCKKISKIVGGQIIQIEEYPYIVQVMPLGSFCGGTILSKSKVLTAAHCLLDFNEPRGPFDPHDVYVFSGANVVNDREANRHRVLKLILHEHFKPETMMNDIGILRVANHFQFGPKVQMAKLVTSDAWMEKIGAVVSVAGWGYSKRRQIEENVDYEEHLHFLRQTYVFLYPNRVCEHIYKENLGPEVICLDGHDERDTCQGDSGGPVLYGKRKELVGITSGGFGCAVVPALYTNVYHFLPWIKEASRELEII